MSDKSFRPATYEYVANSVANLDDRIAAIIESGDIKQAYEPEFITLVALAGDDAAFDAQERLKDSFPKDFKIPEFKRRITVARRALNPPVPIALPGDPDDWKLALLRSDKDGSLLPRTDNVALYLENSPEWRGVLGYNEFTAGYVVLKDPPAPITARTGQELEDHFDIEATRWAERQKLVVRPESMFKIVSAHAQRNKFHPVREFLNSLPPWDKVPRVGTWLIDYCGVQSSDTDPNHYAMAVGEKALISAVARIFAPGCKVDTLLVLEGAQGIGKSTVPRILAGDEWFTDQLADMGGKDASMQLRGVWIVELGELAALNRSEMERTKQFMSQQHERFRVPYGKRIAKVERQCVFIGTTNSDSWLKDETGGRRFWPVRCHSVDMEGLQRDREQLWAEAVALYRSGVKWWLDDPEIIKDAVEQQRERYQEDVWHSKIMEYAQIEADTPMSNPRGSVSVQEILFKLGLEVSKHDLTAAARVGRTLRAEGWERKKTGSRNAREWRYFRPITQDGPISAE